VIWSEPAKICTVFQQTVLQSNVAAKICVGEINGFTKASTYDHDTETGQSAAVFRIQQNLRNPVQRGHPIQRKADGNPVIADSR